MVAFVGSVNVGATGVNGALEPSIIASMKPYIMSSVGNAVRNVPSETVESLVDNMKVAKAPSEHQFVNRVQAKAGPGWEL